MHFFYCVTFSEKRDVIFGYSPQSGLNMSGHEKVMRQLYDIFQPIGIVSRL